MCSRITLAVAGLLGAGLLGVGVFALPSAASASPTHVTGECYDVFAIIGDKQPGITLCVPYLGI